MKGRVKKTNQTIKSNKQSPKKLNEKNRNKIKIKIIKNEMQVLKYSEVKFISALVLAFWLLSASVFGLLTAPARSFPLTLGVGGKPSADFKPAKQVLLFFLDAAGRGEGEAGLCCFFLSLSCVSVDDGGSVWATTFTGTQFQAHNLRALCSPHCPLRICARLMSLIHLLVQPFD